MPMNLGSLLCQRHEHLSTVFVEELSKESGEASDGTGGSSDDGTWRGISAGWRAGKVSWSTG